MKIAYLFWDYSLNLLLLILSIASEESFLFLVLCYSDEKTCPPSFNSLYFHKEWTDNNLRWNESEYGNVSDLRFPPSTIWTPDILMYNR